MNIRPFILVAAFLASLMASAQESAIDLSQCTMADTMIARAAQLKAKKTSSLSIEKEANCGMRLVAVNFPILGFDLAISTGDSTCIISTDGPLFSDKMHELIRKSAKGTKMHIENIKVQAPDGMLRKLPGITIII